MDGFFLTITWLGSAWLLLPVTVFAAAMLYSLGRLAEGWLLLGGLVGVMLLCHLLKLLFGRPRPQVENLLVTMPSDFSFPSAHTAQVTAVAVAAGLLLGRQLGGGGSGLLIWAVVMVLIVLVGWSRVYLQVHYLSDVLAGALLGTGWVLVLHQLLRIRGGE